MGLCLLCGIIARKIKSAIGSGKKDQLRAHTKNKSKEGWFIGVGGDHKESTGGHIFKFYPDKDRVEDLGIYWAGENNYTTSLAMSPDEKYVYYIPAAHGKAHIEGTPVVQYNVKTGTRKIIAFLFPYFYDKYGYIPSGSFCTVLDDKGENLFVLFNGAFTEYDPENREVFGDPSVFVIHIPEDERK